MLGLEPRACSDKGCYTPLSCNESSLSLSFYSYWNVIWSFDDIIGSRASKSLLVSRPPGFADGELSLSHRLTVTTDLEIWINAQVHMNSINVTVFTSSKTVS